MPTLSTLFTDAAWQTLRHFNPIAYSNLIDALYQLFVFFLSPGALLDDMTDVVEFKPPCMALYFRHVHQFADSVP